MAQAASCLSASPRLAQLLAPLPADAEPVLTPAFQRDLARERTAAGERWRAEMRRVYMADYDRRRAGMSLSIAQSGGSVREREWAEVDNATAYQRYVAAVGRQMLIPAPSAVALRWKRKHDALDGGRAEWDAVISADGARLERKI